MLEMSVVDIISQIDSEIHELNKHLNKYSDRTVVYFTADQRYLMKIKLSILNQLYNHSIVRRVDYF
jgi:hypothetical protein